MTRSAHACTLYGWRIRPGYATVMTPPGGLAAMRAWRSARNASFVAVHSAHVRSGRTIGEVLASTVSMLNPSVIVIGGALSEAGDPLLAGVREVVYRRSLPLATAQLRIVPASSGDLAGVVGAAVLAADHVLAPATVDASLV